MAPYEVEFGHTKVFKQFDDLPWEEQLRVSTKIDALAEDPRSPGHQKLEGTKEPAYRVRVGSYRVVYTIDDIDSIVTIVRIGHRNSVYRGL